MPIYRILAISYILLLSVPGIVVSQNTGVPVQLSGELRLYEEDGPICPADEPKTVVFSHASEHLDFVAETLAGNYCHWQAHGTLREGQASIAIRADFRDFSSCSEDSTPVRRTITLGPPAGQSAIHVQGLMIHLFNGRRCARRLRLLGNHSLQVAEPVRAAELYRQAIEFDADPRTARFLATAEYRAAQASGESNPAVWLDVAQVASEAFVNRPVTPVSRSQLRALWLDSLFHAAGTPAGDYGVLASAIQRNERLGESWRHLYYGDSAFNREGTLELIKNGIGEIERDLGRKASEE